MSSSIHKDDVKKEFLYKLKKLMEEYKVDIYFTVSPCSDTAGIYDEKMVISSKMFTTGFNEEIWWEQRSWSIESNDLRS